MYKTFKYSHGKEKYTEILPEHLKKTLFQFRMGTHKLSVNNRKHFNVPRADRYCTNCDKSVMGDEIHFLYECTKLNHLRAKYLFSPHIRRESNVFNFVNIMQTNDPETIGNLAPFILHGLKLCTHDLQCKNCKQDVSTLTIQHNNCDLSCKFYTLCNA